MSPRKNIHRKLESEISFVAFGCLMLLLYSVFLSLSLKLAEKPGALLCQAAGSCLSAAPGLPWPQAVEVHLSIIEHGNCQHRHRIAQSPPRLQLFGRLQGLMSSTSAFYTRPAHSFAL